MNGKKNSVIILPGDVPEKVESFMDLGSVADTNGRTHCDITARIGNARAAFFVLNNIRKLCILNSIDKAVLMNGSDKWRVTKSMLQTIQSFVNKRLRRIQGIWWLATISSNALWDRNNQESIERQIRKRKCSWTGHT